MNSNRIKYIKRICVFGDSLQDNGNLYQQLSFPKMPYHKGRFTNGKVITEY